MLTILLSLIGFGFLIGEVASSSGGSDSEDSSSDSETTRADSEEITLEQQPDGLDLVGTEFAETLPGSEGPDTITAGGGDDFVDSSGGNDSLDSGAGDDILFAGEGNDKILGGEGFDTILGEAGDDKIRGNQDGDVLIGGEGSDSLLGDDGDDLIFASESIDEAALRKALSDGAMNAGDFYPTFFNIDETNPSPDTVDGGRGDDDIVLGAGDVGKGHIGLDEFFIGDWIEDGDDVATITDYTEPDDVIVFVYDPASQPEPSLTTSETPDGDVELFNNNVHVATVQGAAGTFDAFDVLFLAYNRFSA